MFQITVAKIPLILETLNIPLWEILKQYYTTTMHCNFLINISLPFWSYIYIIKYIIGNLPKVTYTEQQPQVIGLELLSEGC